MSESCCGLKQVLANDDDDDDNNNNNTNKPNAGCRSQACCLVT